jgi:hypothetical protein
MFKKVNELSANSHSIMIHQLPETRACNIYLPSQYFPLCFCFTRNVSFRLLYNCALYNLRRTRPSGHSGGGAVASHLTLTVFVSLHSPVPGHVKHTYFSWACVRNENKYLFGPHSMEYKGTSLRHWQADMLTEPVNLQCVIYLMRMVNCAVCLVSVETWSWPHHKSQQIPVVWCSVPGVRSVFKIICICYANINTFLWICIFHKL